MNAFLEQRIANLMGPEPSYEAPMMMAEGGEVFDLDDPETMAEASMAMESTVTDPNADLREAIDQLMVAQKTAEDPFEAAKAEQLMEAAAIGSEAPMGTMAMELAEAGRGGDSMLAHLTPGEVILPLGMMDDPDFERVVENRFNELDLNPEEYVAGLGIASLNPVTGLEEFGFFKKIAKGVKKVVKKVVRPIASVAQFIPGPWQPVAALINKAGTVYDVAKGRASPLALASLATGAGGSFSQNIKDLRNLSTAAGGSGSLFGGLAQAARQSGTALQSGIGNLLGDPSKTLFGSGSGTLRGLAGSASFSGQNPQQILQRLSEDPAQALKIQSLQSAGVSDVDIIQQITGRPANLANLASGFGSGAGTAPQQVTVQSGDTLSEIAQQAGVPLADLMAANPQITEPNLIIPGQVINIPGTGGQQGFLSGLFSGGGRDGVGNMGLLGDLAGSVTDRLGLTNYGLAGGAGGAGGGGFNMGALGAAGLAGLLGKLAYEETKGRKGVPLTPSVVMNAAGRFNLKTKLLADLARRRRIQLSLDCFHKAHCRFLAVVERRLRHKPS